MSRLGRSPTRARGAGARLDPLDAETLEEGVRHLSAMDADLARIWAERGSPPLWEREPGFATLVHIILEQQVSLASARAAFTKLEQKLMKVTPEGFLGLSDDELKLAGFSRQKSAYCRGLARSILDHELELDALDRTDDDRARGILLSIKGIGPWTADIYLLMALLRQDIWPAGDLALATAVQEIKGLPARPDFAEMQAIAAPWRPWRAVAARMLWHEYLSARNLD